MIKIKIISFIVVLFTLLLSSCNEDKATNRTGMQYIYDRQNRIAFSHYIDELDGDWILDEYGIRTWVESLPTKNISMASLASSYHIIGL